MRTLLTSVLILSLTVLAGCTSGGGDGDNGKDVWRIAVIPKGTSHDFWNNVEAGARKADEDFDDVEIIWKGPLTEGETTAQIRTVENFIDDEVDGICLAPLDANALRGPVERAVEQEIPVVIFDSALKNMDGVVSYVASDNLEGGRMAGRYLAELLDGTGNVILLRYQVNSESTEQREDGFMEVMKQHPDIKIVSDNQYGGPTEEKAIEKATNVLDNNRGKVDGMFCPNESNTSGTLIVLRSKPELKDKIKFVGFDAGENIVDGLKAGDLHGTVLQDPFQMGYEAVRKMRDHLQGKQVERRINTRLKVVKFDALDDPVSVELLHPREKHHLLAK